MQSQQHSQGYESEESKRVPVKSVVLAVFLLVIGSILLTLGSLHLRGHIYSKGGAVSVTVSTGVTVKHFRCKARNLAV